MSLLLRAREKQKRRPFTAPPPIAAPPVNRIPLRRHSGSSGGSQGQVMLQRKQSKTVRIDTDKNQVKIIKPNQVTITTPDKPVALQQQSEAQDGVISMEEVLKDLQVLEEQQRESQQKLYAAREAKQRKESQLAALEQELGNLKYDGGKLKAENAQYNKILSKGQREIAAARNGAEKAEKEFNRFNDNLTRALGSKAALIAYIRKEERIICRLEEKAESLHKLQEVLNTRLTKSENELKQLSEQKENVCHQIQDEAYRQQTLASQTADLRSKVSKLECDWDSLHNDYNTAQKNHEEIVSVMEKDESKQLVAINVLKDKKAALSLATSRLTEEMKKASDSNAETQKQLQSAWKRHEDIRVAHNLGSSPPNIRPSLDMEHFGRLLETEQHATVTEEKSKVLLISQTCKLREELLALHNDIGVGQKENQLKLSRIAEKEKVLAALRENESRRKQEAEKVSDQVKELRQAHQKQIDERVLQKAESEQRACAVRDRILLVKKQIEDAQRALAKKHDKLAALKTAQNEASSKLKQNIDIEQTEIQKLEKERAMLSKEIEIDETSPGVDATIKQQIDGILSKYPSLKAVEVTYDPTLTVKEQAKRDLASIIQDCKRRIESAKKMRNDLDEAARREAEERVVLQGESEKEGKPQEETRRRRESRLEEQGAASKKVDRVNQSTSKVKQLVDRHDKKGAEQHVKGEDPSRRHSKKERQKERANRPEHEKDNARKDKNRQKKETSDRTKKKESKNVESTHRPEKNKRSSSVTLKENKNVEGLGKHRDPQNCRTHTKDTTQKVLTGDVNECTKDSAKAHTIDSSDFVVKESHVSSLSAAKPRNLLPTFSQSSKTVDGTVKSVASSQKKVRWQDDDKEKPRKSRGSTVEEKTLKKIKKTFGGNSYSKPHPFGIVHKSNPSSLPYAKPEQETSSNSALAKTSDRDAKKIDRKGKDRSRRERQSDDKNRGHTSKPLARDKSSNPSDSLGNIEEKSKSASRSKSHSDVGKGTGHRLSTIHGTKHRSDRSSTSKAEQVSTKRSSSTSAIDHRPSKRRRNGAPNTSFDTKLSGAKSFGEDVAYSF